jgi:predicted transcriptional regulator
MSFEVPTGADVRIARKEADMSQSELADKANISQGMLSRIERTDVDPKLSTMRKIADALQQ